MFFRLFQSASSVFGNHVQRSLEVLYSTVLLALRKLDFREAKWLGSNGSTRTQASLGGDNLKEGRVRLWGQQLLTPHPAHLFSTPVENKEPADPGLEIQPERRSSHDLHETQEEPESFVELGLLIPWTLSCHPKPTLCLGKKLLGPFYVQEHVCLTYLLFQLMSWNKTQLWSQKKGVSSCNIVAVWHHGKT